MDKLKNRIEQHLRVSWWIYFFLIFCFIAGMFFGSLGVKALDESQRTTLQLYLDNGLEQLGEELNQVFTARQAIWRNVYNLGKIFLLGLTVIGLPLVLVILFTRGFVLGFTITFLLQEKAWQGGILAFLAILPANIISLPVYILAGVLAINFSLYLIKGRESMRTMPISRYFLYYSTIMFGLALVMVAAGFLEGYLSPVIIRFLQ